MKNRKFVSEFVSLFQIILLFVALVMIFLPAININDGDVIYSGLDVVFGKVVIHDILIGTFEYTVLEFSILNLLAYVLIFVGIIILLFMFLNKIKGSKTVDFMMFLILAVAGVLLLFTIKFTIVGEGFTDLYSFFSGSDFNLSNYAKLGTGPIIGGVCTLVASFFSLGKLLLMDK
mgnify:CR=1 FL=1